MKYLKQALTIALDGPAGAGKSTVARILAEKLGILHLDTGAMYRAIGLKAIRQGIRPDDEIAVSQMLAATHLDVRFADGRQQTLVDNEDVTADIRTPEVSRAASDVSALPAVRKALVEIQRRIASGQALVLDGRDIGTYVLPAAPYKFFLTASAEERARRRMLELQEKGDAKADFAEVLQEMQYRDQQDSQRKTAPLCQAKDAVRLDTTGMNIEQVVSAILEKIEI